MATQNTLRVCMKQNRAILKNKFRFVTADDLNKYLKLRKEPNLHMGTYFCVAYHLIKVPCGNHTGCFIQTRAQDSDPLKQLESDFGPAGSDLILKLLSIFFFSEGNPKFLDLRAIYSFIFLSILFALYLFIFFIVMKSFYKNFQEKKLFKIPWG